MARTSKWSEDIGNDIHKHKSGRWKQIYNTLKSKSYAKALADVQKAVNLYVRLDGADSMGNCTCITCGKIGHYKQFDAGHFHSTQFTPIRFDVRNIHPQCKQCNQWGSGKAYEYGQYMLHQYGQKFLDDLSVDKYADTKFTLEELTDIKVDFLAGIRDLQSKFVKKR